MINISNVSFRYPGENTFALKNIDLQIKEGSFTALIGPNGSGKSTLIELIDGLLLPTEGEIQVDGLSTDKYDELIKIRKLLTITFQNPDNQIVGNTVERDIVFGPENLGIQTGEIKKRIDSALSLTGLEPLRSAEPHNLSGGQKQKLAIASVLAMMPKYLLLDEPAAMLDLKSQTQILKILDDLNKKNNITVLLATHSLDMALKADEIIVLDKGSVRKSFNTIDVGDNYQFLIQSGLDLPYWLKFAEELEKTGFKLSGYKDMDSFGEKLCSSLKM